MTARRILLAGMLAAICAVMGDISQWRVQAVALPTSGTSLRSVATTRDRGPELLRAQQTSNRRAPGPTIEAYIRPEFARQIQALRPEILAAAARHNRPATTQMTNDEFAVVIVAILYNENFGYFEEAISPVRALTPLYQRLQVEANAVSGSNLSVWPANIRPSVAVEILQGRVPARTITGFLQVPIRVQGATIRPQRYESQATLYADVTQELTDPRLAVEYLAANLERGIYRAEYEHVQVTWRTLAAWHNQGLVSPAEAHANATSADYLRRITSYLPAARALIAGETCSGPQCTESGIWPE